MSDLLEGVGIFLAVVFGLALFGAFMAWLVDRDGGDAYVVGLFAVMFVVGVIALLAA